MKKIPKGRFSMKEKVLKRMLCILVALSFLLPVNMVTAGDTKDEVDLSIEIVGYTLTDMGNNITTIDAKVINNGTGDAVNFDVLFAWDEPNNTILKEKIKFLKAEDSINISFDWKFISYAHDIIAIVDPENVVDEIEEYNNIDCLPIPIDNEEEERDFGPLSTYPTTWREGESWDRSWDSNSENNWYIKSDSGASNGKYTRQRDYHGSYDYAEWDFTVYQAGTYYFWVRARHYYYACTDVRLFWSGSQIGSSQNWYQIGGEWKWTEFGSKYLSTGSGTLKIKGYSNWYMWADNILITGNPGYTPSGKGFEGSTSHMIGEMPLGEAVDNTDLTWTTGGNAKWFGQDQVYYYDGDAAQSGSISHNQNTWIKTTVNGPGTLKFYWKVSSEANYDYLRFYIGESEKDKISGNVDWQQKTYSISSGSHELMWKYTKDGSVSSGDDCGWLDKVEWITNHPPNTPSKPSGPPSGYVDETYTYSTSTTDPDGDQIKYGWDWNSDLVVDEWTDYYNSGATCYRSHSWSSAGTYYVRVKAKDTHGAESSWSLPLTVNIQSYLIALFSDGFESGTLDPHFWTTSGTNDWRVRVSDSYPHEGLYSVLLDDSTSGGYSYSQLTLTLNLSGQSDSVELRFWWREFGDENHYGDGVFISDDGSNWHKAYSFNNGPNYYIEAVIDIDEEAASAGMSIDNLFYIRFQFYDDYPITTDGYAIDNVVLKGTFVDSDGDGWSDFDENNLYYTDPYKADTDNDGINDPQDVDPLVDLQVTLKTKRIKASEYTYTWREGESWNNSHDSYTGNDWEVKTNTHASNGKYTRQLNTNGIWDWAEWDFYVNKPGMYHIWIRSHRYDEGCSNVEPFWNGNDFYDKLWDDKGPSYDHCWYRLSELEEWGWSWYGTVFMEEGDGTLKIENFYERKPRLGDPWDYMEVDNILITDDPNCVPSGKGVEGSTDYTIGGDDQEFDPGGKPDFYVKTTIAGTTNQSQTWLNDDDVLQDWSAIVNVPDDVVEVPITIELWENDTDGGGNWLSGWDYRKPITINNGGSDLTDYQVKIDVDYVLDHMQSDFRDLRFTKDDGTTLLHYWIETYVASSSATVWVKVPSIPSGDSTIYMYYGNSEASDESDGINAFPYFDHWAIDNTGNWKYGVPSTNYPHRWENTKEFTEYRELRKKSNLVNWWPGSWDHTELGWTKDKSSYIGNVDHVAIQWHQKTSQGASSTNIPVRLWIRKGDTTTYTAYKNVAKPSSTANLYLTLKYSSEKVSYEWKNLDTGVVLASDSITDPSKIPALTDTKYFFTSSLSFGGDYFSHVSPTYLKWGNPSGNGGMEWKTDYWFIRKYDDPEPTYSIGSEDTGGGGDNQLCDINPHEGYKMCNITYNLRNGTWYGDDSLLDIDFIGRTSGEPDGSWDYDANVIFEVSQNDYDSDGITYWQETNEKVYNGSISPEVKNDRYAVIVGAGASCKLHQTKNVGSEISPYKGTYLRYDYGSQWTDYTFYVDVMTNETTDDSPGWIHEEIGIMFRYQNGDNYYILRWEEDGGNDKMYLKKMFNGNCIDLASKSTDLYKGAWYTLKIELNGKHITVSKNNNTPLSGGAPMWEQIFSYTDDSDPLLDGSIALFCWKNEEAWFDDIYVEDSDDNVLLSEGFDYRKKDMWTVVDEFVGSSKWEITDLSTDQEDFYLDPDFVYRVLRLVAHYDEDNIMYLSAAKYRDADGDGINDVNGLGVKDSVNYTIKNWLNDKSDTNDLNLVYMFNHGYYNGTADDSYIVLDSDRDGYCWAMKLEPTPDEDDPDGVIYGEEVDNWLPTYGSGGDIGRLTLIAEACQIGKFIDSLADPNQDRIIIASTTYNTSATPVTGSDWPAFSHTFFKKMASGDASVAEAFNKADQYVDEGNFQSILENQDAKLDDNGIPPGHDYYLPNNGDGFLAARTGL